MSLTRRVGVESGWGWRRDRGWMLISRLGFPIVRELDNQGYEVRLLAVREMMSIQIQVEVHSELLMTTNW